MEPGEHVLVNVNSGSEARPIVKASNPDQPKETRYIHYSKDATSLAASIKEKLSMIAPNPLNYGTVCIYRVPRKHRDKNPRAYTPQLVSIGPLHNGQSQVQAMEEYKLKYLNDFLLTFQVPLESLAEYVHSQKTLVHGCYRDSKVQPKLFSEVILLDGVFIVELFLKNHFPEMREIGDIIFDESWVSDEILHDLLLFENQLPMRFVSTLYRAFAFGGLRKFLDHDVIEAPSFNDLVCGYFKNVGNTEKLKPTRDIRARHLVDFLAILHKPTNPKPRDQQEPSKKFEFVYQKKKKKKLEFAYCARATELQAAGVKFRRREGKCLFEVDFNTRTGELKIPQLTVNDSTETFFLNLIASEQSVHDVKYVTSYVILLDALIDTDKDVELLMKNEIIENKLGSKQQVADVFNNLYKEFVANPKEFYFYKQCDDLNKYSRDIWHTLNSKVTKWFAMLWRDYFGSPWSIIAVVVAFIVLILTVIQTVCSVLQVKPPNSG